MNLGGGSPADEFWLGYGDVMALGGDYFAIDGVAAGAGTLADDDLFRLARIPGRRGTKPGTRDGIVCGCGSWPSTRRFHQHLQRRVAASTAATLRELAWALRPLPSRLLHDATLAAPKRRTRRYPELSLGDFVARLFHDWDNSHGLEIDGGGVVFGDGHLQHGVTREVALAAVRADIDDVEAACALGEAGSRPRGDGRRGAERHAAARRAVHPPARQPRARPRRAVRPARPADRRRLAAPQGRSGLRPRLLEPLAADPKQSILAVVNAPALLRRRGTAEPSARSSAAAAAHLRRTAVRCRRAAGRSSSRRRAR